MDTKVCETCGETFARPDLWGGGWEKRRFCSVACSYARTRPPRKPRARRPGTPCPLCGAAKPPGRGSRYCAECLPSRVQLAKAKALVVSRAWRRANRDRVNARFRERYAANPEPTRTRNAVWRAANPEVWTEVARRSLLKQYGMTDEDFAALLTAQSGVCAICGETNPNGVPLSIDHDHETGAVRGLLCRKCNSGLGLLSDSAEGLRAALAYLDASISRGLGRVTVNRAALVAHGHDCFSAAEDQAASPRTDL